MQRVLKKTYTIDASGDSANNLDISMDTNLPRLYSVNVAWSGLDATDGTIQVYVGADTNNDNSLIQIGSTLTLDSANSNLDAEIYNYEGAISGMRIVYTSNTNTSGEIIATIQGLG